MLDIDITKLMAVWGKAPLKINPCQCLPLRSPKSGCRLCVENCPTKAIEIEQDSIKVADAICTGCGACFNLCPTGVFEMTNFEPDPFVKRAQEAITKNKSIKMGCCKVPFDHAGSEFLRLPCLAHITSSLILRLLSAGADEVMIMDAGICEVCESRCGDRIAKHTISKTRNLLENLGLKQKVLIVAKGISINDLVFEGDRLRNYKDDPELSRREIFSIFKKEAKKAVEGIIKKEAPVKIEAKERLKKAAPKERDELIKFFKKHGLLSYKAKTNSSVFPVVSVNQDCNMCRLCALFCPTDALAIEDTEKGAGIVFKTATCTGCNLCIDVCAEKAITLNHKEVLIEDMVKQNKAMLIWFDKVCCASCGRIFAKIKTENICDTCLKEREVF
ncbi:MAG: 4Fe-4S dicluster domain-containing protein [Deltaproteobacteria bacterium]|nr:4Fe-4S dicluster domain-containing protein [Deltaproteobacteria bacterium]